LLIAHRTDQYKYYPEERFAIMINLDDLTVAFDQVKYLNNQNRSFFRLCGSDFESDGGTDTMVVVLQVLLFLYLTEAIY
jgi:hypothetical protein